MSDTPRTDELENEWAAFNVLGPNGIEDDPKKWEDFARELERENAALQEICIGLENEIAAAHVMERRLKHALEWALDHAEESALEERNHPGEFQKRMKECADILSNVKLSYPGDK